MKSRTMKPSPEVCVRRQPFAFSPIGPLLIAAVVALGAPAASAANLGGLYKTPLGKVKITEKKDGTVVARSVGKNACGLKRRRVVFEGMRLDDSVTGTIHACKVGPDCSGKATGMMMLLITRNGKTLSGAVHLDTGKCKTPLGGDGITISRLEDARTTKKIRPKVARRSKTKRDRTKKSKADRSATSSAAADANEKGPTIAAALEALLQDAAMLQAKGKTEQARAKFQEATELDPESANAFLGLGVTYYLRGRYDEALDEYKNAISANPSNGDSYYNMACIYALQDRKEMAFRYLSIAVLNGYVDESFSKDGDLVSLRDDPRWEQVKLGMPVVANPPSVEEKAKEKPVEESVDAGGKLKMDR